MVDGRGSRWRDVNLGGGIGPTGQSVTSLLSSASAAAAAASTTAIPNGARRDSDSSRGGGTGTADGDDLSSAPNREWRDSKSSRSGGTTTAADGNNLMDNSRRGGEQRRHYLGIIAK